MGHSYEESKAKVFKIIIILGIMTIAEVIFALLGKGHISPAIQFPGYIVALVMIIMSILKAYLIVYEFMHMKYEAPGMVKSVLLPTFLLVWAIVAFFWEGSDWGKRRALIDNKNSMSIEDVKSTGSLFLDEETYNM